MAFGDLLDSVGGMGCFQCLHALLLAIPMMFATINNLAQNFLAAIPEHHCLIHLAVNDTPYGNITGILSEEDLLKVFIPLDARKTPERCLQYNQPQWALLAPNATDANLTGVTVEPCTSGWVYERNQFKSTIVSQWDLVCKQRPLRQLVQSIFMTGLLVGAAILGRLSDKYGRKTIIMFSYLMVAVAGTCTSFSPNFTAFCVFRFLSGMGNSGVLMNTYALGLEWVPTRFRTITSTFIGYFATFGQIVLGGFGYAIRDWQWLQLTIALPFFVFFLYSWWFAESARWLVMAGRSEDAVKELKKVARVNGKTEEGKKLNTEILKSSMLKELSVQKTSCTVMDTVRTPTLRRISICISLVWFSTSFAFYGLAMDLQSFGISIYIVQVIFGSIDIPSKAVTLLAMNYIGRRVAQAASLTLAGLTILATIFVPQEMQILRTSLAVIGKGCVAASFSCIYLYTGELYPTMIRQTGTGLGNTMGRVGGIVAPLVKMTEDYFLFLPLIIYGCAPLISGIAALFLPETMNIPLPDSIEEVESRRRPQIMEERSEVISLPSVKCMPYEEDKQQVMEAEAKELSGVDNYLFHLENSKELQNGPSIAAEDGLPNRQ